jgi:hypothetical protein
LFTSFSSFSEYCCLLNPPPFHRPFSLLFSTSLPKEEVPYHRWENPEREDLQQRVPFPTGLSPPFLDHASFPERKKRENWKERTGDKEFHPPFPPSPFLNRTSFPERKKREIQRGEQKSVEWRNDH